MANGSNQVQISVSLAGRDEVHITGELGADGQLASGQLHGVGGPAMLSLLQEWRPRMVGAISEIPVPKGNDPASILLREALMKLQGQWDFPYQEEELCHCRAIATKVVDMAIVTGAHTPQEVSAQTSASTACGTCRPNVKEIIDYRLSKDNSKESSKESKEKS